MNDCPYLPLFLISFCLALCFSAFFRWPVFFIGMVKLDPKLGSQWPNVALTVLGFWSSILVCCLSRCRFVYVSSLTLDKYSDEAVSVKFAKKKKKNPNSRRSYARASPFTKTIFFLIWSFIATFNIFKLGNECRVGWRLKNTLYWKSCNKANWIIILSSSNLKNTNL